MIPPTVTTLSGLKKDAVPSVVSSAVIGTQPRVGSAVHN